MKKNIFKLIFSLFIGLTILINLDKNIPFLNSLIVDEIIWIINTILIFISIEKLENIKDKRIKIISLIIAIILALFYVVGFSINNYYSLEGIIGSFSLLIKNILKIIGFTYIFYFLLIFLYNNVLPKLEIKKEEELKNKKKLLIICVLLILIAYIPYLFNYFPGILSSDSLDEIRNATTNIGNLNNHHPITHIYIIALCMKLGSFTGNSLNGVLIYSLLQMIFTAITFTYMLNYMHKKGMSKKICFICLLFFMFYPPFATYSITMWKDVPFALSFIYLTIHIIEIVTNKNYFKKKKNIISFLITILAIILFRNNGIYVLLLSLPIITIFIKEKRLILIICTFFTLTFYLFLKGPIFNFLNITDSPVREILSIPIQQIARTVTYNKNNITNEENKIIYNYIQLDDISKAYYPTISDPVKNSFNNELFSKNKGDFIKIWLKLFTKYPKEYIEAFLDNSYGYWYPGTKNCIIHIPNEQYNYFRYKPILNIGIINNIVKYVNNRSIPFISLLWNIGFTFWLVIILLGYTIYKKSKMILAMIPILILWLTTIASPVWCEYRYIYSMFTTLPLLTILTTFIVNKNEN